MAEVTLYVSAPPASQYQKGSTLAISGSSLQEVTAELNAFAGDETGETLVRDIVGSNLAKAVLQTGAPDQATDSTPAAPAAPAGDLATDTLLKVVAKKHGITVDELKSRHPRLTDAEAKALLKEVK